MKVAVKDANVFIDMELMGLFDLWASLGYETLTTTMIVFELEAGEHSEALAYIGTDLITVIEPKATEVGMLRNALGHSVSTQDASVLFIAIQNNALLLTGDRRLRMNAELLDVECHGSIWILDQLVRMEKIEGQVAAAKLIGLLAFDGDQARHLPKKIARTYIERWKSM
jgi:predicted nucleic acid-binding protein